VNIHGIFSASMNSQGIFSQQCTYTCLADSIEADCRPDMGVHTHPDRALAPISWRTIQTLLSKPADPPATVYKQYTRVLKIRHVFVFTLQQFLKSSRIKGTVPQDGGQDGPMEQ
jgi:hypothetical protein